MYSHERNIWLTRADGHEYRNRSLLTHCEEMVGVARANVVCT